MPAPFKETIERAGGKMEKLVTIVMMCYDHYEFEFDQCVIDLEVYSRKHGIILYKHRSRATDVEKGRYEAVKNGMYGNWLFFLDSDQVIPPDTLVRLMEHDVPICGTLVVTKSPPHLPVTGMGKKEDGMRPIMDWPRNALIEVDATGFGCCLIKREVFEAFPDHNPFLKVYCDALKDNYGEDWSFCIRAKEHNFPIYVDTSIPVGHKGGYIFTLGDFELYRDKIHICEEGKPYYYTCTHPKLIKRIEKHNLMDNVLVMGDPSGANKQIEVVKQKPEPAKVLNFMGQPA